MAHLAGKVALVTGGGRGIGPIIARRLADDGAEIIATYGASRAGADQVVKDITAKGGKATAVQCDLAKRADILKVFEHIDRNGGRLDILINCATMSGITPLADPVGEKHLQDYLAINMLAPFYLTGEAAKRMPSGGRVVNFSSTVVHFPFPKSAMYTGTKAAQEAFSKVWAKELGPQGITVNTVIPGATSPGMIDGSPQYTEFFAKSSPFNRIGRADEVASVVAFLCSPEASWVSGTEIMVNGAANT
jgi:3-oxoacyl-[acyl-carrier protein] reductase